MGLISCKNYVPGFDVNVALIQWSFGSHHGTCLPCEIWFVHTNRSHSHLAGMNTCREGGLCKKKGGSQINNIKIVMLLLIVVTVEHVDAAARSGKLLQSTEQRQ